MTQAYEVPGVSVTRVLESVSGDVGTGDLSPAVIGDCYQVEVKAEAGSYNGTASVHGYPKKISGAEVEVGSTATYPPVVYVQIGGIDFDVTIDGTIDGTDVSLPDNLVTTLQTEKTDGVAAGKVYTSAMAEFITNGVQSGDFILIGSNPYEIVTVTSNTRVELLKAASGGTYTVTRDLTGGEVLITYRARRTDADIKNKFLRATGPSDLVDLFGADAVNTHWNPVGLGMSLALQAGGVAVGGVGIDTTATAATEYSLAIEELNKQAVYNIAPLTMDTALQDQVIQHVKESSDRQDRERRAYVARAINASEVIISDGAAGVVDATAKTLTSSGATFDTAPAKVRIGDVIAIGTQSFPVSAVTSGTVLTTTATVTAESSSAFTITRNYTPDEEATNAAAVARGIKSERVTLVGGNTVDMTINEETETLDAFYLAAIKAGQRSGSSIGRPLIRAALPFATNVGKGSDYFNRDQLNRMAGAGWQLFVRDAPGAPVYCRDELTTDQSIGPKNGQESEVVARDYASYLFRDTLRPQIGTFNITPRTLSIVRLTIDSITANLLRERYKPFTAIQVVTIVESSANAGRVEVTLRFTQSDPLTGIDVTLII